MPKSKTDKASLPLNPAKGTAWEVKSRGTACVASGKPFEEGEAFMSRLVAVADGWEREDYCLGEWNDERRKGGLFYWRTQFRLPPPKKEEPFKEENAEEAFREMVDASDPEQINTLFILAVMLERKRILVEQGAQKDPGGRTIRIYEHRDSGETFLIPDPEPSLEDIEALREEVARTLGWIKPEPDPAPEPEETAEDEETEADGGAEKIEADD